MLEILALAKSLVFAQFLIPWSPKKADDYYTLSENQRKIQRFNAKKHGKKVIHKVVKGDSLWLISNRYGVPTDSIIKWNHLVNATKELKIGQKLMIWQVPKLQASKLKNITKIGVNVLQT
jgi:membrane-bound lytic murein transglycosylase D